jgi:hypothetical protein
MTRGEAYNLYRALKAKCSPTKISHPHWKLNGGRGVRFCFNSVEEFIKCVGEAPTARHRLARWPKTTGNYEAGNLRWLLPHIPAREQLRASRQKPAKATTQELQKEIPHTTPALPPLTPAFW